MLPDLKSNLMIFASKQIKFLDLKKF